MQIAFGYNIDDFTEEKITLYTTDSPTYESSLENIAQDTTPNNFKNIKLKWIHMLDEKTAEEKGLPATIIDKEEIIADDENSMEKRILSYYNKETASSA
jgi:hypothetical protein